MLRVCCFALCLAIVSSSAINNKRQIGNAFEDYEQHPAARQRDKFIINRRVPVGPPKSIPLSLECKTKNSNGKCKQVTPRGGTFLTNLEGTSLGPGFPPKPVGLLVRPNVSREEVSSTVAPKGRFLVDDTPPMPPPPLKRRPLPKGRLRRPLLNSGERQGSSKEGIDPMILGPLFYEDLHNPESTTQAEENTKGAFLENASGSGERNRALLDSFNELDHPDPKLLSKLKGKLYPKYYAEKRNSQLNDKEKLHRPNAENEEEDESNENSEEANNSREEDDNSEKALEEESPVSVEEAPVEESSEDYESSKEEGNQDNSEEEHSSHHPAEEESTEEEDEPVLVSDPDNQENSEEDKNPPDEHSREEEESEEAEEGSVPPDSPASKEGLDSPPLIKQSPNGSLENSGQNSSSSREEEGPESEDSSEDKEKNSASDEAVHSDEESTEDRDYSEENNNIDSSAPSEDETFHLTVEEETSDESNESVQKPASSSEDTNEIRTSSIESPEEVNEDYDSREQHSQEQQSEEQHSQEQQSKEQYSKEQQSEEEISQEHHSQEQQSEESPDKPSSEYEEEDEEEKPTDYYDMPDYDSASPESEYEDMFPKPEQEPTKKPQVYYKKRPATFYYIVRGSEGEKKEPNNDSDDVENGSKPLDYEDNKLKQSEVDSSTPSAEEHPSSSSDESFSSMGFDSFDLDSVLKSPQVESDVKTTKSPVAVITNTTPQTATTKCDDNNAKNNEDPEDRKRLKTPVGTVKPNTLQPGDVVSFTRACPVDFGLSPTAQTTTSTFRPATISAIGIIKPGGSIIAKVVSPSLQVQSSTSTSPAKADDDAQTEAPTRLAQVPWKTLLAAREATALTYLKPPPIGQTQTWFLRQARTPRFVGFLSRPL